MSQASTSSANPTVWDAQQCQTDNKTDNTITLVVAPWETQALQSSIWSAPRGVGLWGLTRSLEKASLNCAHVTHSETICEVPNTVAMPKRLESQLILQFSGHGQILWSRSSQATWKTFFWSNATECYWYQWRHSRNVASLVAGLCRLPKLQVCELSDLNKLNQIDLCMSFVHWCGDISMAEAKSFWSSCLLRCFRNMCLMWFLAQVVLVFWPMTAQQHWQLGSLIELWIIVLQRDYKLLPGLERLPALDFIGTPMADRASYPGLQDNLPRAQDWSSE